MASRRTLRFAHAADLHLDSPFRGLSALSPDASRRLHRALFQALDSLVELCIENEVCFLLVAGDVFDWQTPSLKAQLHFRDGLARLARKGVRSFVVLGNHDPLAGKGLPIGWPDGVHVFGSSDVETVFVDGPGGRIAAISGISHQGPGDVRNLVSMFPRSREDCFHVGLVHANLGPHTGHAPYAPCTMEDLRSRGMDYWALGHVHTRRVLSRDPWVVYPGNIQGLSIREQGARGCYLVEVEEGGAISLDFRPLDGVRWALAEVSITGVSHLDLLEEAIEKEIGRLVADAGGRALVCRIRLTGCGRLYHLLGKRDAAGELVARQRERFSGGTELVWIQDLVLDCLPEIDLEARGKAGDLLGQVLRVADSLEEDGERLEESLKEVLAPLYSHPLARGVLEGPGRDELEQVLHRARGLLAYLFEGRDA